MANENFRSLSVLYPIRMLVYRGPSFTSADVHSFGRDSGRGLGRKAVI